MVGDDALLRPALLKTLAELSLDASESQTRQLLQYLSLLQRWNTTYNLTAVRDPHQMLVQHLGDCLAIVPPLAARCGDVPMRTLDVGSGAGLPGLVLAIMRPAWAVTCVDTVGKKVAFIRQAIGELALEHAQGLHARVESIKAAPFDLITSRAFSSLGEFVGLTRGLLKPDGTWLAMKGKTPTQELQALSSDIDVFHVEQLQVPSLDAARCLVWMRRAVKASTHPPASL